MATNSKQIPANVKLELNHFFPLKPVWDILSNVWKQPQTGSVQVLSALVLQSGKSRFQPEAVSDRMSWSKSWWAEKLAPAKVFRCWDWSGDFEASRFISSSSWYTVKLFRFDYARSGQWSWPNDNQSKYFWQNNETASSYRDGADIAANLEVVTRTFPWWIVTYAILGKPE